MKLNLLVIFAVTLLTSCKSKSDTNLEIQGTWQLISGTTIENGSSKITDYTKDFKMIKIINNTHFAFLKHSINPKDTADFDAGGGSYTLNGDQYIEHLEYYRDKNWAGKRFEFKLAFHQDTLIQTGVEKVEEAGVNRVIIEKYIKAP
ncbi:hypothetical protein DU508_01360 [Pedobacter chinensis]|uniref:Lipocalin-like domain-containing protein n=1 Tax=Pedobacter chinensis TaxID=2282421 RepID=A0A369Q5S2_9SPHI|nr:hypothetical protein [Pedobacter chinensis]RDC57638.1 hypothetical protein DU508_01360 [Pedobacter chinensis]